jgi:hypothetical protein
MQNAIDILTIDRPYRTGPMALTDLHAGGVFFCIVYAECLQFSADAKVRRWREVIDASRPFDNEEKEMREFNEVGSFQINGRGYLTCQFPSLLLTGLPCRDADGLLAFNAWYKSSQQSTGLVYVAPAP